MPQRTNVVKLMEAQAEARCAVLHLMTAVSEMHTAMTLPHYEQRNLIAHACREVEEAQRVLCDVVTLVKKREYRPRRKPRKLSQNSMVAVERRDARRKNG